MARCNRVIDLYSGDTNRDPAIDFQVVKEQGGVHAIIHKATEGGDYQDKMYAKVREAATAAGLLWGAYHFSTGRDVGEQLDNFLTVVRGEVPTLLVLDFEESHSTSMTLSQAGEFVTRIKDQTGKWPGLYAGHYMRGQLAHFLSEDHALQALGNLLHCWFWAVRYNSEVDEPSPPPFWTRWRLWQYTDGKSGSHPHSVPGIGPCDRNFFNGSDEELAAFWAEHSVIVE